jgi:hypothetical protein
MIGMLHFPPEITDRLNRSFPLFLCVSVVTVSFLPPMSISSSASPYSLCTVICENDYSIPEEICEEVTSDGITLSLLITDYCLLITPPQERRRKDAEMDAAIFITLVEKNVNMDSELTAMRI